MNTCTKLSITLAMTLGLTAGAFADTPKEKAPEAKTAPDAAKKAPDAAPMKAPEPPKKMEMPKPPAEVEALAKTLAGNWKCTGKSLDMTDMKSMVDMKVAMSMKLDMNKWWISGTLKATGKMAFNGQMYTTYDVPSKKWYRLMVDNWGGSETSWSTGMKDNKLVWEGEGRGSMGVWKARTTEEMKGPKEVNMTGEGSMDNGKTWMKMWEAACKK